MSDNYLRTAEVAKILGVCKNTVLSYEAKGWLKPEKRIGKMRTRLYSRDKVMQFKERLLA